MGLGKSLYVYIFTPTYDIQDQFLLTWNIQYQWSFRFLKKDSW